MEIFEKINDISRIFKIKINSELKKRDITYSQFLILNEVYDKDYVSQKEILNKLGIRGATLTGIIDNLFKKGYIRRVVSKTDKRVRNICITDFGIKKYGECKSIVDGIKSKVLIEFSVKDAKKIDKLLEKLIESIVKE